MKCTRTLLKAIWRSSQRRWFYAAPLRSFSKTWNLLHLSLWVSTLGIPFFSFWIPRQQVSFGRCFTISSALRETKQSEKPRYFYSRNNEYNNKLDYGFLWLLCTIFFNFSNLLKTSAKSIRWLFMYDYILIV